MDRQLRTPERGRPSPQKIGRRLCCALLDLFFPPKCPFCGKILDAVSICGECDRDLPWVPEEQVLEETGDLTCAAPLWYEGSVRQALLRLKFRGVSALAEPMGALIAQCAAEQLSGAFDTVTWVPVSRKRLRQRGFDQSRLLAESACRLWDTRPVQLLAKVQDTPAQSGLAGAAARRANVLGAYDPVEPAAIRGKRILLIDDILTTGATLTECVRVLEEAGAQRVVCAALARTPREKSAKNSQIQPCAPDKHPL